MNLQAIKLFKALLPETFSLFIHSQKNKFGKCKTFLNFMGLSLAKSKIFVL